MGLMKLIFASMVISGFLAGHILGANFMKLKQAISLFALGCLGKSSNFLLLRNQHGPYLLMKEYNCAKLKRSLSMLSSIELRNDLLRVLFYQNPNSNKHSGTFVR